MKLQLYSIFNNIVYFCRFFQCTELKSALSVNKYISTSWKSTSAFGSFRCAMVVGLFLIMAVAARGQNITDPCGPPACTVIDTNNSQLRDTVCSGDVITFTVGYNASNTVVLKANAPSVSAPTPQQLNLPNGTPDDSGSCVYRSSLIVSGYNGYVVDENSIMYVRLNIEHDNAADLNIRLKCPSDTSLSILKSYFSTNNNPVECGGNLSFSGGWTEPNPGHPDFPCAFGDGNGTGWDYCWSSNDNTDYVYALDDGIIYRDYNNLDDDYRFIPSSLPLGTFLNPFYHPDDNFSGFAGCAINGIWTIEIVDGNPDNHDWNGTLFDWEIVFDDNLAGGGGAIDSASVVIPGSNGQTGTIIPCSSDGSDMAFSFTAPVFSHDSTVEYTLRLYDTVEHCYYDTVIRVLVRGAGIAHFDGEL